jgi:hypothetical protein
MDMRRPASRLESDGSLFGKTFVVGDLKAWRALGGTKRLAAATHRLWKTRLGATRVNRSMQYQSVCESYSCPFLVKDRRASCGSLRT